MSQPLRNRLVVGLLRSPLHVLASRMLIAVTLHRRSDGKAFTFPVMYAADGNDLWVLVGWSERKYWWRNLREGPQEAGVLLRGTWLQMPAALAEPDETAHGLAVYLTRFPRAAKPLGLTAQDGSLDPGAVATYAESVVLVRLGGTNRSPDPV